MNGMNDLNQGQVNRAGHPLTGPASLVFGLKPVLFAVDYTAQGPAGTLVSTQRAAALPFPIQRVFWSFGVPENVLKANHAHRHDRKILIALQGQISVVTETAQTEQFTLEHPGQALYVPALCWLQLHYAAGSILLALSATDYDEQDYIRDYKQFKQLRQALPTE